MPSLIILHLRYLSLTCNVAEGPVLSFAVSRYDRAIDSPFAPCGVFVSIWKYVSTAVYSSCGDDLCRKIIRGVVCSTGRDIAGGGGNGKAYDSLIFIGVRQRWRASGAVASWRCCAVYGDRRNRASAAGRQMGNGVKTGNGIELKKNESINENMLSASSENRHAGTTAARGNIRGARITQRLALYTCACTRTRCTRLLALKIMKGGRKKISEKWQNRRRK